MSAVLWDMLEQMQARLQELEEQLRLTSRNSSTPPSSDGPAPERRYPERTGVVVGVEVNPVIRG